MSIRLPAPPHTGCTSGISFDPPETGVAADRRGGVDRRTALRLTGGAAVGALALDAATGCADDTVYEPDPLAAQEVRARADAATATAAIALAPHRHAALSTIATERTAHADALRAEINRMIGVYGDGTTPVRRTRQLDPARAGVTGSAVATGTAVPQPAPPPTSESLRDQLTRSQQSAALLARTQSGYRAGLLASISAACATQTGVLLA